MQPRFSIQIVAVISLSLTVVTTPMTASDCAGWNSEEYFEAAAAADVTDCIQSGADLKARDEGGKTPLHVAAGVTENPAVITVLLDAGADLEARDERGHTPLHFAALFTENPAVITVLLDAGADLEARDEGDKTPLHWAALFTENPAVITVLLDAGADLKARAVNGKTPWDYAKDNKLLKGSDAYWRLNDARF